MKNVSVQLCTESDFTARQDLTQKTECWTSLYKTAFALFAVPQTMLTHTPRSATDGVVVRIGAPASVIFGMRNVPGTHASFMDGHRETFARSVAASRGTWLHMSGSRWVSLL
jgi:hypothetical protein